MRRTPLIHRAAPWWRVHHRRHRLSPSSPTTTLSCFVLKIDVKCNLFSLRIFDPVRLTIYFHWRSFTVFLLKRSPIVDFASLSIIHHRLGGPAISVPQPRAITLQVDRISFFIFPPCLCVNRHESKEVLRSCRARILSPDLAFR
jgi:hypothetical protein